MRIPIGTIDKYFTLEDAMATAVDQFDEVLKVIAEAFPWFDGMLPEQRSHCLIDFGERLP